MAKNLYEHILNLKLNDCLLIGDSVADLEVAYANQIPFLLRKHKSNVESFSTYSGPYVSDFLNYESI